MPNAKIVATITENGIDVVLTNWDGVTNMMLEHVHYAIVKESQKHRAKKLGLVHKEKMEAEAAVRADTAAKLLETESNAMVPINNDFVKELQHVL
jgi:hypothetical protein